MIYSVVGHEVSDTRPTSRLVYYLMVMMMMMIMIRKIKCLLKIEARVIPVVIGALGNDTNIEH